MTRVVSRLRLYLLTVFTIGMILGFATNVAAQSYVLNVPSQGTIRGVQTPHMIGRASIPRSYIGTTCSVTATAHNDSSTHPESNLRITSGASSLLLTDVERVAGIQTQASRDMQLSDTITVHITSLDKRGYSASVTVSIECPETPDPQPEQPPIVEEVPDKRTPEVPDSREPTPIEESLPPTTGDLPRTGPGAVSGIFFATSVIASVVHRRLRT